MQYFLSIVFTLITFNTLFSQQLLQNDNEYLVQDSVLIPTRSGIDISATIVRKNNNTEPLPVLLFHTTYSQGAIIHTKFRLA